MGRRSAPRCASASRRPSPNTILADGFGSSETGAQGTARPEAGDDARAAFAPMDDTTVVLDEAMQPVPPGSATVGRVARTGHIPLRYHGDPEKTADTFVELDGRRWVITGDMATVAEDGTIELLGRGSGCINTGGEKVFPEEVESVLRERDDVYDVLVVGAPDERWGERVAAIVQPAPGTAPTADALIEHCRGHLAGYKLPEAGGLRGPGRALARGQARLPLGQGRRQRLTSGP